MADEQQSVLKVLVQLVDQVSAPLRKINDSFEEFSESVHGILTSGAEVFAGYEAIKGLVEPAMAMEEALTRLGLAGDYSADQLAKFKEQAQGLSTQFPKDAESIVAAQTNLAKHFSDVSDIQKGTEIATKLATVFKTDAADAATQLSNAVEQLGDHTKPVNEQMTYLADRLAVLSNKTPLNLQRLNVDLQQLGKQAATLHIPVDQMFAIYGRLGQMGAGGRGGPGRVTDEILKVIGEIKKGGNILSPYIAYYKGNINAIATLHNLANLATTNPEKLQNLMRRLPDQALALARLVQDFPALQAMWDKMNGAAGQNDATAKLLANTPEAKMERLKDSLQNMADTIGTALLPQLTPLVTILRKWTEAIDGFLKAHPGFTKALGDIALGIAALLTLGGAYGFLKIIWNVIRLGYELLAIPTIFSLIQGAWFVLQTVMVDGFAEIGTAMLLAFESNPIGWIITATILIGLATYEVWKHWDDIKKTIHEATTELENFLKHMTVDQYHQTLIGLATGQAVPMAIAGVHHAYENRNGSANVTIAPQVTVTVPPGMDAHGVAAAVSGGLTDHIKSGLQEFFDGQWHENARRSFQDTTTQGAR